MPDESPNVPTDVPTESEPAPEPAKPTKPELPPSITDEEIVKMVLASAKKAREEDAKLPAIYDADDGIAFPPSDDGL